MDRIKPNKIELLVLAVLAGVLCLWLLLPGKSGGSVTVTVDGVEVGSYSLLQACRIPIEGYGGYGLELVIEGGEAHVEEATCPDLICQNHKAVSKAGSQIICLPARTVITVEQSDATEEEEAEPDAVVG